MQDPIQARLETLKKELEKGQAELQKVEAQRTYLHESVLRISGAVQVLEELLEEGQPAGQKEAAPSEKQPPSTRADEAKA
jgi:predicted nuclease with TOPRIM domain